MRREKVESVGRGRKVQGIRERRGDGEILLIEKAKGAECEMGRK